MIEECNFRSRGLSGLNSKEDDIKMYCGLATFDTALSKDGKTIDRFIKINPLCSGEDNCILYQTYKDTRKPSYLDVEKYYIDDGK